MAFSRARCRAAMMVFRTTSSDSGTLMLVGSLYSTSAVASGGVADGAGKAGVPEAAGYWVWY